MIHHGFLWRHIPMPMEIQLLFIKNCHSNTGEELTQNMWELFYYYKYVKGINMEERAPYFTEMFADRVSL